MTAKQLTEMVEENTKILVKDIVQKLQVYGFWCLLVFGVGVWCGVNYCNHTTDKDKHKSILLGGFIFKNITSGKDEVFDVRKRP
jgi:hypothetical protein